MKLKETFAITQNVTETDTISVFQIAFLGSKKLVFAAEISETQSKKYNKNETCKRPFQKLNVKLAFLTISRKFFFWFSVCDG